MPLPLLQHKRYDAPSAFTPESLLREARRQKGLEVAAVPAGCVLDPDGDLVRRLRGDGRARIDRTWACYHTDLYRASVDGLELGLLGCAVGAPFAVLVAEELFASGCRLLISITSAGQLVELRPPPYFVLIEKLCVMRAQAITTCLPRNSVRPIQRCCPFSPADLTASA